MRQVYSNNKIFRFTDRLNALAEGKPIAPVHVRIKPTNKCNHDCWYCAYRASNLQLGDGMNEADSIPQDKMFGLVDDLVEVGVKAVTFSGGGEPMLYKPLPECVDRLADGGISVASLTNGSNLKGRVGEAFARRGTWVRVSLDAWDDESYAKSRGVKVGAYSKVLDNMRQFAGTGTSCALGVSFIITKENHRHILDVCRQIKDVGVEHIKLSGAVVANDAHANNLYHKEIADTVHDQIEHAMELNDSSFRVVNHYHELNERFEKQYTSCPFVNMLTVIGADSRIYACQDRAYTVNGVIGSLADGRFRDVWFSGEAQARRKAINPASDCCHHCVAHRKNEAILDYISQDTKHSAFV